VHVKLRPLNKLELNQGHYQSIFCVDQSVTALYYPTFQVLTDAALEVHSNEFDGNHNENTTHDEFFHSSCSSILHIVHNSNGGEGAIFAYGQTGSGKTYTINGVAERLVKDLPYSSSEIHIQLLEIMGDNVKDLLSGNLVKVMINSEGNPTLVGNSVLRQIMDEVECLNTINEGFKLRKTIGTSKNDTSSRSHFICQIQIRHLKTNKISNIKLVDLAGSERHSDSKNHDSERLKEAIYINSSLMALKDCIRNKIHKSKNNDVRIPTRSSKLTTLLKNVLDPVDESNVRLVMIAAMSPSTHDVAHSLDTFRYAAALKPNCKSSTNKPKSNSSSESVVSTKPSVKSQTDSSPMAWSKSKLNSWIEINSERKVTLDDFIVQRTSDNNDFIPPPWKMLYDLTAEEWKLRSKLTLKQATVLRNSYKSLFLKKR
ncbi:P-loop containing nucleoside triphosphate hydrolase protein, partial [Globomyces pollinis-pini]